MAAGGIAMALILGLSANPVGARIGTLIAGLFLAIPCFVWDSPLRRGLMMCLMPAPFAAAAALVRAPSIAGVRERLAYLFTWCGTRDIVRRPRNFDLALLLQLMIATTVLAAAIAAVKVVSEHELWLPWRWLAGGIAIFAFAEMATAAVPLVAGALGVTVPPLMQSPYRSTSVQEFWTKRWNPATSSSFRKNCFTPLARHSPGLALVAAFAASGVGHALLFYMALGQWKIALIQGSFFLAQPILLATERSLNVRRWPPVAGWIWTFIALAITSPLFVEPTLQLFEQSGGMSDSPVLGAVLMLAFVLVFSSFVSLASFVSVNASGKNYSCAPVANSVHGR